MTTDSYIETTGGGTMFSGADAVALFQATAIRSAIELYLRTGIKASRAYTPGNMVAAASRFTLRQHKASRKGMVEASECLAVWINAMKAALPVVDGNKVSIANMNPAAMAAALRNASKNT